MRLRSRLEKLPGPSAVAIGNFDGFHAGHQKILATLEKTARRRKLAVRGPHFPSPSPPFFQPAHPPDQHRPPAPGNPGPAGRWIIFFSSISPPWPLCRPMILSHSVLLDTLRMKVLVIGEDFRFGRGREGDLAHLRREAAAGPFPDHPVPDRENRRLPGGEFPDPQKTRRRSHRCGQPHAGQALLYRGHRGKGSGARENTGFSDHQRRHRQFDPSRRRLPYADRDRRAPVSFGHQYRICPHFPGPGRGYP